MLPAFGAEVLDLAVAGPLPAVDTDRTQGQVRREADTPAERTALGRQAGPGVSRHWRDSRRVASPQGAAAGASGSRGEGPRPEEMQRRGRRRDPSHSDLLASKIQLQNWDGAALGRELHFQAGRPWAAPARASCPGLQDGPGQGLQPPGGPGDRQAPRPSLLPFSGSQPRLPHTRERAPKALGSEQLRGWRGEKECPRGSPHPGAQPGPSAARASGAGSWCSPQGPSGGPSTPARRGPASGGAAVGLPAASLL